MNIAIDASFRLVGAGLVRLRHLMTAWSTTGIDAQHRVTLYVREESIRLIQSRLSPRAAVRVIGRGRLSGLDKLLWEQLALPRLLHQDRQDVLLCPGNIAPFRSPIPSVVVFDNIGSFCSSITPQSSGLHDWAWWRTLGVFMRLSARTATRVIFTSHYSRELFIQKFGVPAIRADVIYQGRDGLKEPANESNAHMRHSLQSPFILCVSHLYPYKNLPQLIKAYALARGSLQSEGVRLVIVGEAKRASYRRKLDALVRQLGLAEWVLLVGALPHAQVGDLLSKCHCFVFQSTCENCPTALIEALAARVPIASSKVGVMPEIAGRAALYFDPFDPDDIASALIRVSNDEGLRRALRGLADGEARKFPTWREVGLMTLRSLERAVAGVEAGSDPVTQTE